MKPNRLTITRDTVRSGKLVMKTLSIRVMTLLIGDLAAAQELFRDLISDSN